MAKTKIQPKISAGLLMYRIRNGALEVFLAHPGGPFFHKKDEGYWGIPKGLVDPGEDCLKAAIREFQEETGLPVRQAGLAPEGEFLPLGEITQKSGKRVHAWGFAGDWPEGKMPEGNTFIMEWPPKSGKQKEFPEIDRAAFFSVTEAEKKMIEAQQLFLDRLAEQLKIGTPACRQAGGKPAESIVTAAAIEVQHLNKTFVSQAQGHKKIQALRDVHLRIFQGEIFGLLGPNGAGKTTLLNILSTLLLPDAGTVTILGIRSTEKNSRMLRTFLNMSSGYPNFPWCLSVEENLRFYGRLYGLPTQVLEKKIEHVMDLMDLGRFAKVPFDELSSGTKQKLSLAKALINDPKIIFLDEPTVGLDPHVAVKIRETILTILHKTSATILLTTHNMLEAEALCGRIAFIKDGRILKVATPTELKQFYNKENLEQIFIALAGTKTEALTLNGHSEGTTEPQEREAMFQIKQHSLMHSAQGWLKRSLAFFCRNFLFGTRNFFTFMELLFWPVVSLISIGLLGDFLQLQENALAFVLTGAITAGVLQVTQLDVAYGLLYEVWSKSMKQTLLTPVGVSESLFGSWLNGIVRGSVIFSVLGLSAMVLFGFPVPHLAATVVFLLGIFGCALILGLLVNVLLLTFGQKAEITAWMFAYLFMLLSGIYYPIATLPAFFYHWAQGVPITYFLEYFRQYFGFTPNHSWPLLKGFGLMALYLGLGLLLLRWAFHRARKKGIILKLSE